jgi:hypothetical protein
MIPGVLSLSWESAVPLNQGPHTDPIAMAGLTDRCNP